MQHRSSCREAESAGASDRWRLIVSGVCFLALPILAFTIASCAKDPITGKRQLVLISEADELSLGLNASQDVDRTMGIYPDAELNQYLTEVGSRLALASERPQLPWKFQVVESPVVNAFAIPGGYIYFTRGILAYLNNEAALTGVMGHEIGHVTARHTVEQLSRQQLAGLGVNLGMIFVPEVRPFGDVLGGSLGLLFLRFGRDAERESDRLGVRYSLSQGYDPREMAKFFAVLGKLSRNSGRSIPGWASTHPDPEEREATILRLTEEQAPPGVELKVVEDDYKRRIDGLIHGENPRDGYLECRRFVHPDLRFELEFPPDWPVWNSRQVVYSASPDQGAAIQLTATGVNEGTLPETHARDFFQKNRLEFGTGERLRVGAFSAYRAPFRVQTNSGVIVGEAGFIIDGAMAYEILGLTRQSTLRRFSPLFRQVISSFDRLRDRRALEIQPWRIHLVTASREMTLQEVLTQASTEEDQFAELALLNNRELSDRVAAGTRIKTLRRSP